MPSHQYRDSSHPVMNTAHTILEDSDFNYALGGHNAVLSSIVTVTLSGVKVGRGTESSVNSRNLETS